MANILVPSVIKLSSLAFRTRRHMARAEYDQIMSDLAVLAAQASAAITADRHDLAQRKQKYPASHTVELHYDMEPQQREVRCSNPLAHALLKLLQDLIALDEEWAAFAWSADYGKPITRDWQEVSQVAAYDSKYHDWLDLLHHLRQAIRVHLKTLRQALSQPRAA